MQVRKRLLHWLYVRKASAGAGGKTSGTSPFIVISVAFNNPDLIALQAEALARFVESDYEFVVVDNSSDADKRQEIQSITENCAGEYVGAPSNPYSWIDPSLSHSLAMDWAWRNLVTPRTNPFVVLLDHDLFPVAPVTLEGVIGSAHLAGFKRVSGDRWLLWPGLLVINRSLVEHFRISFMPKKNTDSGGSLWWSIYSKLDSRSIRFLTREEIVFADDSIRAGDGSSGEVHLFDDTWLHLVDGSGWSDGVAKAQRLFLNGGGSRLEQILDFLNAERSKRGSAGGA